MRDVFGTEPVGTEGSPSIPSTTATGGAMTATAVAPTPAPAPTGATPTLQQATDKAIAKAGADAVVATDPHAVHGVVIAASSPQSLGATGSGAGIGFLLGGPPGALLGAGIGFITQRYGIGGGGPSAWWSKAVAKVKGIGKPAGT